MTNIYISVYCKGEIYWPDYLVILNHVLSTLEKVMERFTPEGKWEAVIVSAYEILLLKVDFTEEPHRHIT